MLPNNSLVLPNNSLVLPKQIYKVLGPVVSGLGFRDIGYIGVDLLVFLGSGDILVLIYVT